VAVTASQLFVRNFMEFLSLLCLCPEESHMTAHRKRPARHDSSAIPVPAHLRLHLRGSSILTLRHDSSLVTNHMLL